KPSIFGTNYFLKDADGEYCNGILEKKIWLLWMEGRVHNEYDAIKTPIGYLPLYADIKALYRQVFDTDFTQEQYDAQFSLRLTKLLERLDRIEKSFAEEEDVPEVFTAQLDAQRERLQALQEEKDSSVVKPSELE
ncbi:MAG: phosphoenolpyruvate carboxykinase domain-containing protein, partial [Candidatus Thorarchaeota archaeon]